MNGLESCEHGGLLLAGLDGSNPLAFLAALGTLRVLDLAKDDPFEPPRMCWHRLGSAWRPCALATVRGSALGEQDAFVEHLAAALERFCDDRPFGWADDTAVSPDVFRAFVEGTGGEASRSDRRCADFAAAFASEILVDRQGRAQDTALRTMSGAGHQHFLASMRELVSLTQREHLQTALFEPWRYEDDRPSMRWDPMDDRRYALRWRNPSKDEIRTVRGANRLAIEALPLMATAPRSSGLETTGFEGKTWIWPIWERPADVLVVRSLLTHPALRRGHDGALDSLLLRELGITEAFRSERITVGKVRNFTPAVPLVASAEQVRPSP